MSNNNSYGSYNHNCQYNNKGSKFSGDDYGNYNKLKNNSFSQGYETNKHKKKYGNKCNNNQPAFFNKNESTIDSDKLINTNSNASFDNIKQLNANFSSIMQSADSWDNIKSTNNLLNKLSPDNLNKTEEPKNIIEPPKVY